MPLIHLPNFLSCAWTHSDYLKRTENFVMDRTTVLELGKIFNGLMRDRGLNNCVASLKELDPAQCKLFLDQLHAAIAEDNTIGAAVLQELEICGFKKVSFFSYERAQGKIIALKQFIDQVGNNSDPNHNYYNVTCRSRVPDLKLTPVSKARLSRNLEEARLDSSNFGAKKNGGHYYRHLLRLLHEKAADYKDALNTARFQTVGNFYWDSERRAKAKIFALQELLPPPPQDLSELDGLDEPAPPIHRYTIEQEFIHHIETCVREQQVDPSLISDPQFQKNAKALTTALKENETALRSGERISILLPDDAQMYVSLEVQEYSHTFRLYDADGVERQKIEGGLLPEFIQLLSIPDSPGRLRLTVNT